MEQRLYEIELEYWKRQLQNLGFEICHPLERMLDPVSDKNKIVLLYNFQCWCLDFDDEFDDTVYQYPNNVCAIHVKASDGCGVTWFDCVKALHEANWKPACSHRYLEKIELVKDNIYTVSCGS